MSQYKSLKNSSLLGSGADYLEGLFEDIQNEADLTDEGQQWSELFGQISSSEQTAPTRPLSVIRQQFTNHHGYSVTQTSAKASNPKQSKVSDLISNYRLKGHYKGNIDPLGMLQAPLLPELTLEGLGLSDKDLQSVFEGGSLTNNQPETLENIIAKLEHIYCGTLGVEFMHITEFSQQEWIRSRIEGSMYQSLMNDTTKKWLMERLVAAESLEKYLHTQYVGQKRFSLEGGESLIPCLDSLVELSGKSKVRELVVGMAHRGRLNVLINILGKHPEELFQEFEGKADSQLLAGDVKYHQGFSSNAEIDGQPLHIVLAFNPSHLEIVSPVVEGSVRARQDRRGDTDGSEVIPIVIHGDASFAGQGVVMEMLNMSESRGYTTHGTIHIIINNQIGFTTSFINDARSTPYCTDVAKMLNVPILHVNGDDPEAVYFATKLAFEYRQTFHQDVVIDLVCYRRHGHNEADEPAVTQPVMYKTIRQLPTTRQLYGKHLVEQNIITEVELTQLQNEYRENLKKGNCVAPYIFEHNVVAKDMQNMQNMQKVDWKPYVMHQEDFYTDIDTTYPLQKLQGLGKSLTTIPSDFSLHSRAKNILKQRQEMTEGRRNLDWGMAENLAYATLLDEGFDVRITGQDVRRGTFFHRHATFHNTEYKRACTPLKHIKENQPLFTIVDSLLSEEAVLAFEYGYASSSPATLVVWEAQFGDFANGAQVVIDQFISSGEAKWGRYCGLTLLLPHGYEGQGPEHSSARPERFFQLCAEDNMQLVVPSTPAQIFHLLRLQMISKLRKPLIIMSPKSLLRLPEAVSSLDELANGTFQKVIDDPEVTDASSITEVVFCSGKIYYELKQRLHTEKLDHIAIVRVERHYPFPYRDIIAIFKRYTQAKVYRWCQEEPQNQGAWRAIRHRFERTLSFLKSKQSVLIFAGRESSASPAVGSGKIHKQQQDLLIERALGLAELPTSERKWQQFI